MSGIAIKFAIAIALLVAGVLGGQWYLQGERKAADRQGYERAQGEHAKQAFMASEHARQEEARREAGLKEVIDVTRKELEGARTAAASAAAAGRRLRVELAAARGRACAKDTSPAARGAPAAASEHLLADVQQRLDEAQEQIARFADEASAAGRACERGYDKLTRPTGSAPPPARARGRQPQPAP